MIYNHLRGLGFKTGIAGPVIFQASLEISLVQNQREYKVEQNSPVERAWVVGLWTPKEGAKINNTLTQASGAVFDSAYYMIRVRNDDTIEKIYLHQIRAANIQGRPFYLYLPGQINLSDSTLTIPENATIAANTAIELNIDYGLPQ